MIEILFAWLLQCVMIPDFDEFSMCIDNVVLEYKVSELEQQKIMKKMLFAVLWVLIWMIITVLFYTI